jgi:hypothetical protein
MHAIIKGKKYDTETARRIGSREDWDDSVNYWQHETFYLKRTGEFFRVDDKRTTWGNIYNYKRIVPISLEEAKSALEKILKVEIYEKVFGEVEE